MSEVAAKLPLGFKNALSEYGFNPMPLRAVGFKKSVESNWSLPWHQDRVVAMAEKIPHPDLKNWSCKSGVWHCEPAPSILARMAFAHIAFDNIRDSQGGLELAEDTHKSGTICAETIDSHIKASKIVCPTLKAGDVLLISALMLHRSSAMKMQCSRKTLRVDFVKRALNLSK